MKAPILRFGDDQLASLRSAYTRIESCPLDLAQRLIARVHASSDSIIVQLSEAGIRWITPLARNERVRRGLGHAEMRS